MNHKNIPFSKSPFYKKSQREIPRFAKLFALAEELGMGTGTEAHAWLRECAAQYTGIPSLRSLKKFDQWQLEVQLQEMVNRNWAEKRAYICSQFKHSRHLEDTQQNFLIDLVTRVFGDVPKFRTWARELLGKPEKSLWNESLLLKFEAKKLIGALVDMRARGYKIQ